MTQPYEAFCKCMRFTFWYRTDEGVEYCHCSHDRSEHLDNERSCVGEVIVYPGREKQMYEGRIERVASNAARLSLAQQTRSRSDQLQAFAAALGGEPEATASADARFKELMTKESVEDAAQQKLSMAKTLTTKWGDIEDGAILMFRKTAGDFEATYVALKINDKWYLTGTDRGTTSKRPWDWKTFVTWLISGTPTTELWQLVVASEEPVSQADVEEWSRRFMTRTESKVAPATDADIREGVVRIEEE